MNKIFVKFELQNLSVYGKDANDKLYRISSCAPSEYYVKHGGKSEFESWDEFMHAVDSNKEQYGLIYGGQVYGKLRYRIFKSQKYLSCLDMVNNCSPLTE